jgi:hypothetical protein
MKSMDIAGKTILITGTGRAPAVRPADTAIVPRDTEWLQPVQTVRILRPSDIADTACKIVADDSQHTTHVIVDNAPA